MNKKEYIKFLESEGEDYVWQFTKQDASFENAFNSTKLFEEWKYISDKSKTLDQFYKIKHDSYNLVDNYRALIIAQFLGLVTKKSSSYADEDITPVFNKISLSSNPEEFSTYISEQILKIKLPAIIYSKKEQIPEERYIFPVIFIYQILKKLKKISIRDLYAFVMTMNSHRDISMVLNFITKEKHLKISDELFNSYKGRSRMLTLIKNIDLFIIDSDHITLNKKYIQKMDSFLKKNNFYNNETLRNESNYKNFLINFQGFKINLKEHLIINEESQLQSSIKEDNNYVVDVNSTVITEDVSKLNSAYNVEPEIRDINTSVYKRNAEIGKLSIINSNFKCEFNPEHKTFISRVTKSNYVEAHHLIPMQYQIEFWEKYNKNIDCVQNIISLCPICHRALHYGVSDAKKII
jgi:5-methylcytosine-specific restriction protein A